MITDEQADEIREAYKTKCSTCGKKTTMEELGIRYGVSKVSIFNIVAGYSHKKRT